MTISTKAKKTIIIIATICAAFMILWAFDIISFKPKFAKGTFYGTADISKMTVGKAIPIADKEIRKILDNTDITVKLSKPEVEDSKVVISGKDLTYSSDLEKYFKNAVENKDSTKYTPEFDVNTEDIENQLINVSKDFDTEPKDAKSLGFDLDTKALNIEHAVTGYKLNINETAQVVSKAMKQGTSTSVDAKIDKLEPSIKDEDVNINYTLLSTYSTISTNTANGNHNMQLALSKFNGTELKPGDTFSYNQMLGDSTTAASGFLPAHIIVDGVLIDGYGGGICQPSSTLYITALNSGMEIVERYSHSMPSTYVPIGLDATVSYGTFDLKFKNTLDYPVYIFGDMNGTTVTTSIYGVKPDEWDDVKVSSWCSEVISKPAKPIYKVDNSLSKNQVVEHTNGHDGYRANAIRAFYKNGQEVKTENLSSSRYYEKAATYRVGPGTDTSNIIDGKYVEPEPEPSPDDTEIPDPPTE